MQALQEHLSLTHLRLCKNRTSLHFAMEAAKREHLPEVQTLMIISAYNTTITLITDLDALLNFTGRPAPPEPL